MNIHTDIVALVAGYRAYADADEFAVTPASDPPSTTVPCGAFSSQICEGAAQTIKFNC